MAILKQERPNNYFRIQRNALKLVGISLTGNESYAYKIYSYFIFVTLVTFTMVECYSIFKFFDDLDVLAMILSLAITHILGVLKIYVLFIYRVRIGETLDNLEKGAFAPNEERGGIIEEHWVRDCVSFTNVQTAVYWICVALDWSFGVGSTIIKRFRSSNYKDWQMPFVPFSLFETNTSNKFAVAWLYQISCITIFALIISAIDLVIVGVLAHVCTQFKILLNFTKSIGNKSGDAVMNCTPSDEEGNELIALEGNYDNKILGQVVDYHQAIIDLTETFEELFNILVLTVFMSNALILCFSMYHASLYPLTSVQCIQDFIYITVIITQIFIYCFWGNQITFESLKVAVACYEVDFVGLDVKLQKGLVLIMQRSQKPIVLTAGKFAALSLQTFVGILKVSYSYYMVLRETNVTD